MSRQFNLFDPEPQAVPPADAHASGRHSLFFATLPDVETAANIVGLATHLNQHNGLHGKQLDADRLHVTLHGLGESSPRLVDLARQAAASIRMHSFAIEFDRALSFKASPERDRPFVLCGGSDGMAELMKFWQRLGLAMKGLRLPVERNDTPHMTLLYAKNGAEEQAIEPIRWMVKEFVLIDSHVGQHRHEILGRWVLQD